jgi:hypothetical protein
MPKTLIENIENKDGGIINISSQDKKGSFGHALYYPHIHLTNEKWLKYAFLFWDKISRIVPDYFQPKDNETVVKMIAATNFIENYYPTREVLENSYLKFANFLQNGEYVQKQLLNETNRKLMIEHRRIVRNSLGWRSNNQSEGYTFINKAKMSQQLFELLVSLNLAEISEIQDLEEFGFTWIKLNKHLGFIYMNYLAQSIGEEKSIPIITDNEKFHNFYMPHHKNTLHELGYLLIDTVIPKNINALSMKRLIKFRNKYDDQRVQFFDELNKLSVTLPSIDNKSALEDALHYHNKLLVKQTKELKRTYELNRIDVISKPLAMSMMAGAATDYIMPTEDKILGLSAGLAYGVVSSYSAFKQKELKKQKHPMSYLLNIESDLDKKSLFERIQNFTRPKNY